MDERSSVMSLFAEKEVGDFTGVSGRSVNLDDKLKQTM